MESDPQAYPLQWPPGWPRTSQPTWSRFDTSETEAKHGLINELRLLGARNVVISTNVELRRDGLPYSNRRTPDDPGVAVYFTLNGRQQCIPCDKWRTIGENMQAVRKTIEALRGLERWGAKEMVEAAFQGFKALPAAGGTVVTTNQAWWEVLGVPSNATKAEIRVAYHKKAHETHPDQGGSDAEFQRVQDAYRQGLSTNG